MMDRPILRDGLVQQIIDKWRSLGVEMPGVGADAVNAFEILYGVVLPRSMRSLWTISDGMQEGTSDDMFIRFWSLAEVVPVSSHMTGCDLQAYAGVYLFADYSIWAHAYGVVMAANSELPLEAVVKVGGNKPSM